MPGTGHTGNLEGELKHTDRRLLVLYYLSVIGYNPTQSKHEFLSNTMHIKNTGVKIFHEGTIDKESKRPHYLWRVWWLSRVFRD
jgi:hypothetical protein